MDEVFLDTPAYRLFFEKRVKTANRLCILASSAAPSMIAWVLKEYEKSKIKNVDIELIICETADAGIDDTAHTSFKELHHNIDGKWGWKRFSCSYLFEKIKVPKNLYIWLKDEEPLVAFQCGFELTQKTMLNSKKVSIISCDPYNAYEAYGKAVKNSIYCNHAEIEDYIVIHSVRDSIGLNVVETKFECVTLSLLTNRGETGKRSGLNWGHRNKRNKNQAYIPLPIKIARTGFFPLNGRHFVALTDDRRSLLLRVEQQNDKAITTPISNALLGEYFRSRLDLPNGEFVTKQHLLDYGRTDVSFYKIDDEQFYMDFSVNEQDDE